MSSRRQNAFKFLVFTIVIKKIVARMDDIYLFGRKKYVPAEPVDKSVLRTLKNIFFVLISSVKCAVIGIFIIFKSLLFMVIPSTTKDIQNSVALVRSKINSLTIFLYFGFIFIYFRLCR